MQLSSLSSPLIPQQRPVPSSPVDPVEVRAAVRSALRGGADRPYTTRHRAVIFDAAISGARDGAEVAKAASAVLGSLPTGAAGPYTAQQQMGVLDAALRGPFELDSLAARIEQVKREFPAGPQRPDAAEFQTRLLIRIYGANRFPSRPAHH